MNEQEAFAFNRVLRCELTAVNQQFIHVLALRAWGDEATAARIMEVDEVDFPNAMRIVAHLLACGAPLELAPDRFTPGNDRAAILAAEEAMERRLQHSLDAAACSDAAAQDLIATAQAPRADYATWLAEERLKEQAAGESAPLPDRGAAADLLTHLVALVEQPLVHAFLQRQGGTTEDADAAWATSGAAMMLATDLVRRLALRRALPPPGRYPEMRIANQPGEALAFDRRLAKDCADLAEEALRQGEAGAETEAFESTRAQCLAIADWAPGQPHPAAASNPPAFASFDATVERYGLAR